MEYLTDFETLPGGQVTLMQKALLMRKRRKSRGKMVKVMPVTWLSPVSRRIDLLAAFLNPIPCS